MPAPALLDSISLEPSPVVEAYKKDVDRTLIQQNLMLSVEERVTKMLSALRLAEEIRRSRPVHR
jgi:hypothetical protein